MTKRAAMLSMLAAALLALFTVNQPWLTVHYSDAGAAHTLQLSGAQLQQLLLPLPIAALIGALVWGLLGRLGRLIVSVLIAVSGAALIALCVQTLQTGSAAAATDLATRTGLTGGAQLELITDFSHSPFGWVSLSAGALLAVTAVAGLTVRAEKTTKRSSKYERPAGRATASAAPVAPAGGQGAPPPSAETDRIGDWDALSRDSDPTAAA